jgi:hypothetical protein
MRAAAEFLARQPGVDPRNVRLAGHGFGGSVAIGVSQESGIECLLSRIVVVSPGRGRPYTRDDHFVHLAERLSSDMGLDPPLTLHDARATYEPMQLRALLEGGEAIDIALLNTSDEEERDPLGPQILESDTTADFRVLPLTDHYMGTQRRFNRRNLPVKIYHARPLGNLVEAILAPFAESSTDCAVTPPVNESTGGAPPGIRMISGPRIAVRSGLRYPVTATGTPEPLIGDSITQAWMELGSDFNYRAYIDSLVEHGLNATLLWSFIASSPGRRIADERIGYDAPALWPWCGSARDRNFDLNCHNPAYFSRLRDFVGYADERGIIVVLTVHDGWLKDRFDAHPFSATLGNGPLTDRAQYVELARYGQELPRELDPRWDRRYHNQYFQERFCERLIDELEPFHNVIYEIFNEGEWYDARRRRQHEEHFLRFFLTRTAAPLASNTDHISGIDPGNDPDVDVISLHFPKWSTQVEARTVFEHYARAVRESSAKPVLFSETVPEFRGNPGELDALTRVLWGTLLGGGNILVQDDVAFRFAEDSPMAARSREGDELLTRIGVANRFARRINLVDLEPDPDLCSSEICMAQRGIQYVVFAESGNEVWLDLSEVSGRLVELTWIDPRSGAITAPVTGRADGRMILQPPLADTVLHVAVVPPDSEEH